MQNGHVESFHGRLRDECLNASWFRTLNDVRSTLASWRREYNEERPHSSLNYRTPEELSDLSLSGWSVHFIEADSKIPLRRCLNFASAEKVIEMAERGGAVLNVEGRQALEHDGDRAWTGVAEPG